MGMLPQTAMRQMHLSARTYQRMLKLARTIDDLVGAQNIGPAHLAGAIQYRSRRVECKAGRDDISCLFPLSL